MELQEISEINKELGNLCATVKEYLSLGEYKKCEALIYSAMIKHPHSPEPHNLIGILLEKEGDHATAMRHFRAAWVLDPTYLPARINLDTFGTFYSKGICAYDINDCQEDDRRQYHTEYDSHGIGHVVMRR